MLDIFEGDGGYKFWRSITGEYWGINFGIFFPGWSGLTLAGGQDWGGVHKWGD